VGRAFSNSYLAGEAAALAFFAPGFRDGEIRVAAARRAGGRSVAPALLEVLAEQQLRLPASAARQANLRALAGGGAAVVATGQQVGLFLGPLYAFYKAASAIAVARAIEAESGVRCVPLFWLQTEDHDFTEIASCTVAGRDGEPVRLALADEQDGQGRVSVAHRVLGPEVAEALGALAEALDPGPAADEVLQLLRACYQPGKSLAGAFASVLATVFADEGLLILDPRDARLAALAAPIYRSALENSEAIERQLKQRRDALAMAGFDEQVAVRERGALVFFHRDSPTGPRFRLQRRQAASDWELAGSSEIISHDDLLATLAREPLRFSTSALLRPMVQDALLPTVAYVGGPGEINYFAQLGPLYQHFGLAPPLLVPRARFRFIDARTRRWLALLGLQAADLSAPAPAIEARLNVARPPGCPDPLELRALVAGQIAPAVVTIANAVVAADEHLRRPALRARESVAYRLERLIDRYARTLVERDDNTNRRLHRAKLALLPNGAPQERFYAWPSLAGRLGVARFKQLVGQALQTAGPFSTDIHELEA
jgi:bacillithiol biosynthesis cysteine-adding enzyme BshC